MAKNRGFEKCIDAPADTVLPRRKTKHSAGYDFVMPCDVLIPAGEEKVIKFNVKAYMQGDELLELYIRSSLAFKYGLKMTNAVGIIDSDYYGNPDNDGNIAACFENGTLLPVVLHKGDRVAQGIFKKYLLADGDNATEERVGGVGSTGK